ncbi:ABC transporter permease [Kribbia dieselivorans]|uniref:ABC transporter permease n=1 Tax=Kribbia dieselivorans TaxID=331526 RepID=UPI0008383F60|nr:FtsX-like permease family protein [Kribbia dieselivorans]
MLKATLKSLMARKVRLIMSAIAVILGVAFVAGSMIFSDTLTKVFDGINAGTTSDVVVRQQSGENIAVSGPIAGVTISAKDVAKIAAVDGVAAADGNVTDSATYVIGKDGKLIGGNGAPGLAYNWVDGGQKNLAGEEILTLNEGRAPARKGEVVLDDQTAKRGDLKVGDKVNLITSGEFPRISATLVGIAHFGSGSVAGATLTLFDTATAQGYYQGGKDVFTDVAVTADPGVSQTELRDRVAPVLPANYEAVTGDDAVAQASEAIGQQLGFLNNFLLIFAAIALFVGGFLIINTFTILVAQRGRELALYRAMGAQRRQITTSVVIEAIIVGLIGSTLGLALGALLAMGISWLMGQVGLDMSGTTLVFSPRTAIVAYVVGMVVTVVAAWLPAYRAGKVSPMAAMREDVVVEEGSMRNRLIIGAVIAILGAVALSLGLFTDIDNALYYVGGGMVGVLLGVAMTSPIVGRPFLALAGWVNRKISGIVGVMAHQNSVRNPRRTAATASALMIGMALVTTMSVFGQSAKASIDETINDQMAADFLISSPVGMPFSAAVAKDVSKVNGVQTAGGESFFSAKDGDRDVFGYVMEAALLKDLQPVTMDQGTDSYRKGEMLVSTAERDKVGLKLGETLTLTNGPKTTSLKIVGFYSKMASAGEVPYLITPSDATALGMPSTITSVLVKLAPGADKEAVRSGIDTAIEGLPLISAMDRDEYSETLRGQFDQLLTIIYALLGLAVIIAVLGIVNTLSLSVLERTREFGMLRAIGLRRRQLFGMITMESVTISLLGAVIGTGLGLIFGIMLQQALKGDGFTTLAVPWVQVVLTFVAVAIVGVLAAVFPARRASKLQVLDAIRED